MSIRNLKDGSKKPWLCECYPNGRNGKRVRKRFTTKGEAAAFELHIMKQIDDKPWLGEKPDHRRLSDLFNLWFGLYGNTLINGKDMMSRFSNMIDAMGNPLANQFNAKQYASFRSRRMSGEINFNQSRHKTHKAVGNATLNSELSRFKAVFNKLIELGEWKKANPLESLKPLKDREKEMGFLSTEQISLLLDDISQNKNPDMLKIVKLCLSTGARWGEAANLRGSQLSQFKVTFVSTKNGKNRSVPISKELYEEIYKPTSGKLFRECYKAFSYTLKHRLELDVPMGQASHILRHTFASHFMMNGGNILVLKDILGHADIKMTMRYAHFAPEHLSEALEKNPIATIKN